MDIKQVKPTNWPIVTAVTLAIIISIAISGLIIVLFQQTNTIRDNAILAEEQIDFGERLFLNTQRFILLSLVELAEDDVDLNRLGQHYTFINQNMGRIALPMNIDPTSAETQSSIIALKERWDSEVNPIFLSFLETPNDELQAQLVAALQNFEPTIEPVRSIYAGDRRDAASQLAANTVTLLNQMQVILLVLLGIGGSIIIFSTGTIVYLWRTSQQREQARQELAQLNQELERRVQERTRNLNIAGDISRQITTVLNLRELLPQLVKATQQAFTLYAVGLFLYEPGSQKLILAEGIKANKKRLSVEAISFDIEARPSLVAKAGRERNPIVINDVSQEDAFAASELLPDTQSEATLPMVVGDELIGVLAFQSDTVNRFTPADVDIFTTLTEQIAIAIKNAQLYDKQIQLAEELRRADEIKSKFLATMSHELRTPLNAIMNFTEMVALGMIGPVTEEQAKLLHQVLDNSDHLLNLINDVLDLSKIQADRLVLFVEEDVDLYKELETVTNTIEALLKDKPVTLVQDIEDDLPLVAVDRRRVRQILLNLLSNATKFTKAGHITLHVEHQNNHILFTVSDTGSGISEEQQKIIFEPFIQTEDGLKQRQGTGLGLPITKSLVEAHGGHLWVQSESGEGATFFAKIPLKPPAS